MIPLWRNPRPGSISRRFTQFPSFSEVRNFWIPSKRREFTVPWACTKWKWFSTTPWPKKSLKSWVNLVAYKSKLANKNSMKSLHLQKNSHLIDHSLSHFSPVLVREDQEHFNRSILPGLFLRNGAIVTANSLANCENSPSSSSPSSSPTLGIPGQNPPNGKGFEKPQQGCIDWS